MQVLLKKNCYFNLTKATEEQQAAIEAAKGTWVEVETENLFKDQYNITIAGYGLRVMDRKIEAVKDDARIGACRCEYCGKTFKSIDDYNNHITEQENSIQDCDSCYWYRRKEAAPTEHKTAREISADGKTETVINTMILHYTDKVCTYAEKYGGCAKKQCKTRAPFIFTKENTYFLKYPNGYDTYFSSLTLAEKLQELGATVTTGYKGSGLYAEISDTKGTYNAIMLISESGNLDGITFKNSKAAYNIDREQINFAIANCVYYSPTLVNEVLGIDATAKAAQESISRLFFRIIENYYLNNTFEYVLGLHSKNFLMTREIYNNGGYREKYALMNYHDKTSADDYSTTTYYYTKDGDEYFAIYDNNKNCWIG